MPKTEIITPIVSERFVLTRAGGVPQALVAQLGAPYVVDEIESRCPAKIQGLDPQYPDIAGANRLQALALALKLLYARLEHAIERGDELTLEGEDDSLDVGRLRVLFGMSDLPPKE